MDIWDGKRPLTERIVTQRDALSLHGIGMNFVRESIAAPTDWAFRNDHHAIVIHREGAMHSMESVFERGPSGHVLPAVGDIWVIPAGERYAAVAHGDMVGFCEMAVPTALLGNRETTARIGHRDPFLWQAAERLASLADRRDDIALMLRDTIGETLRVHLIDSYAVGQPVRRRGAGQPLTDADRRRLVEHVGDAIAASHKLEDLAALVDMAVPDFLPAFASAFGTTPHQFVIRLRLRRAREYLATTRSSVTEVGLSVGFSTPSHFASSFKQHFGMSPSDYRRTVSGS